jgi:hypothetical protein
MGVAGSPHSSTPLAAAAAGIRKSYNPSYMGAQQTQQGPAAPPPAPQNLYQAPGPGYNLHHEAVAHHSSLPQQMGGWQQQQQQQTPHPYYRSAVGLPMGMRGEAMAHAQQHGLMPAMMPDGPGMYYGPASAAAAVVGGGGRMGPHPGRPGGGGPMAGRAMYLNRPQPYLDQMQAGPGMHAMEGRPPPGYHSPGSF